MPPNEEAADQVLAKRTMDRKLIEALESSVQQRVQFEVAVTKELGELNTSLKLIYAKMEEGSKWMDNTNKIIWGDPLKLGQDGLIAVASRNAENIKSCGDIHAKSMEALKKEMDGELNRVKTIWGSVMFFGGVVWSYLIDRFMHRGP